jgi:hypothetical protein
MCQEEEERVRLGTRTGNKHFIKFDSNTSFLDGFGFNL